MRISEAMRTRMSPFVSMGWGGRLGVVAVLALTLSACHRQSSDTIAAAEANDPNRIECAPAGATSFDRVCHVDREESPRGLVLSIVKPDGGFRRLLVLKDGRGLIAADGAQPASITIIGPASIEVAIGGDRFRLPAKLKPHAGAK